MRTRDPKALLKLLQNQEFCHEAYAVLTQIAAFAESHPDERHRSVFVAEVIPSFTQKWGVFPPHAPDLVHPDPRRRLVEAIASGRWGLVPIFAWTTNRAIERMTKKIRRVVRQQHRDADNTRRAQLARWLESCGISSSEIAKAVWGRRQGLRRLSKAEVIHKLPEEEETRLLEAYQKRGLSFKEAEQRLYRQARGSEPKAAVAVRMSKVRYVQDAERLNAALASPTPSEPVSYAVTMLLRASMDGKDEAEIRRCVAAIQQALLPPSSVTQR